MDYTVTRVTKGDKTVIGKSDIAMVHVAQYIYGIPFSLSILSLNRLNLEVNKKYSINYKSIKQELVLSEINHEKVGGKEYNKFVFMHKEFTDILAVKGTTNTKIKSIALNNIVNEREKQLKRLIFEVRKKASFLTLNSSGDYEISSFQRCTSKKKKTTNAKLVAIDANKGLRRKNYYTLKDGTVTRTKKGKNDPIYLPFCDPQHIRNLDSFVIPKYRIISEVTNLKIGDTVEVDKNKFIVMEVEILNADTCMAYAIIGGLSA